MFLVSERFLESLEIKHTLFSKNECALAKALFGKGLDILQEELKNENSEDVVFTLSIIPLLCIFTICDAECTTLSSIIKLIGKSPKKYNILKTQVTIWWEKKNLDSSVIETIFTLVKKYMNDTSGAFRIKTILSENLIDPTKLSTFIDAFLIPDSNDKKQNAEVSTPAFLRKNMLDSLPSSFWKEERLVFEPCAGKGGFLIDILARFMEGLKEKYSDERERKQEILRRLYFADINGLNIFICRLLLDPLDEYDLVYYQGNTLHMTLDDIGVYEFNLVIGNPPYNSSGSVGTGNTIWQHFVTSSLSSWVRENGYLCFVHPSGWRKPCYNKSQLKNLYSLMTTDNYMIYLEIHGLTDGKKTFKCGTRYDWYLIQRCKNNSRKTTIIEEDGNQYIVDASKLEWIPNKNASIVYKLLKREKDEGVKIFMNSAYHAIRDYISDKKTEKFKYPCVHSTPKKEIRYRYSSRNDKGHFGVPKVIFGESGIYSPILDFNGEFATTQGAMFIIIETVKEGQCIIKAITSEKFSIFLDSCKFGNFRIDWRLFTYLKKDFWKEF